MSFINQVNTLASRPKCLILNMIVLVLGRFNMYEPLASYYMGTQWQVKLETG